MQNQLKCGDGELWLIDLAASLDALQECWRLVLAGPLAGNAAPEDDLPGAAGPLRSDRGAALRAGGSDREWRVAAYQALRLLLARHVGAEVAAGELAIGSGGRPSLPGCGLDFNLSHTGRHALIGIARAGPIGVDLETVRPARIGKERRDLIERAVAALDAAVEARSRPESSDGDRAFIEAWVRLEALAKATGEGVGALLSVLRSDGGEDALSRYAARHGLIVSGVDIDGATDLVAAVAVPRLGTEIAMRHLPSSFAELYPVLSVRARAPCSDAAEGVEGRLAAQLCLPSASAAGAICARLSAAMLPEFTTTSEIG